MDLASVQKLITVYNKSADYYNKNRKKLLKLSQNDTKEGNKAYNQLASIYRKAITDRKRAVDAVKIYRMSITTSKSTASKTKKPATKKSSSKR